MRPHVRVLKGHDDLGGDKFHAWVPKPSATERLDALGRSGNNGSYRWDHWTCINVNCAADVIVRRAEVDDEIRTWLPPAEPPRSR